MKPLEIDREADLESIQAQAYYEEQRENLGERFIDALLEACKRIERSPRSFSFFKNTPFRKCLMKKFPYTVYFHELDEVVRIIAVAHQSRREGYWLDRAES